VKERGRKEGGRRGGGKWCGTGPIVIFVGGSAGPSLGTPVAVRGVCARSSP
jgi:hypothetical protein